MPSALIVDPIVVVFMDGGFLVVGLLPTDDFISVCSVDLILHPLIPRCILGRPLEGLWTLWTALQRGEPARISAARDSERSAQGSDRLSPYGDGGVIFSSYPQACNVQ